MVNLEWYRTFKSVYKNGNFSVAAKELFISQPAVSQQISMLEAHVGYKLFNRKSKGVEATEYAKLLNNLIIDALDRLENVESGFRAKAEDSKRLISIGVSKDLFNSFGSTLISKFDLIDFTFAEDDVLFSLVDAKKIDFAVARDEGLHHLDEIISNYESQVSLSREEFKKYLSENISYSIDESMHKGLDLYFKLAYKNNLINSYKPLNFIHA